MKAILQAHLARPCARRRFSEVRCIGDQPFQAAGMAFPLDWSGTVGKVSLGRGDGTLLDRALYRRLRRRLSHRAALGG